MTYLEYLLLFIILPLCLLVFLSVFKTKGSTYNDFKTNFGFPFIILAFIALFYTTPWDNYLVAQDIWSYDPSKVIGIIIGFVPIEEYSFFILETLFVSFIFYMNFNNMFDRELIDSHPNGSTTKFITFSSMTIIWFLCLITFSFQLNNLMYLNLLLLWAIPPILIQLIVGWNIIWHYKTKIFLNIMIIGSYLSITDAFAIYSGIWTISSNFTSGIGILFMPIEEILFFFLTTLLIIFGFTNISYISHEYVLKSKVSVETT